MKFRIKKKAPRHRPLKDIPTTTTAWHEDPDIRRWADWAISLIGSDKWAVRRKELEAFGKNLYQLTPQRGAANFNYPVVPEDRGGWYLYQAELYLTNPHEYDLPQGCRVLPMINRLGNRLDEIVQIPGAVDRMRRALMQPGSDIDSTLFELIVASAYARRGFTHVTFIPESSAKSPDLKMLRYGSEFFVECKRKRKTTDYARKERERWWTISLPLREKITSLQIPVVVDIAFHIPLLNLPDDYLDRRVVPLMNLATYGTIINDHELSVTLKPVRLKETREALQTTMIRLDSTLLYDKLYGQFDRWKGHTGIGLFHPNPTNPRFIEDVSFAAGCIWSCDALETMRAKAQHFRRELAKAVGQLPSAMPSAVHLGYEAYDGEGVETIRYERLKNEMMDGFDPEDKCLEMIYCHLFEFESTPTENWAVNETCNYWAKNEKSKCYLLDPTLLLIEH